MSAIATLTARRSSAPEPSPGLYGHHAGPVPAGCVVFPAADRRVGDVVHHAAGTFDLVTSIATIPTGTSRQVHVLRTVPTGRTTTCSFWAGEHARRTVHKLVGRSG